MNECEKSDEVDIERARKIIESSDKELITAMLVSSGVRTSKNGFEYLKIAVQLYKAYDGAMEEISKVIAAMYSTNCAAIEKDMRKALREASARDIAGNFNGKIGSRVFRGGNTRITPKEYVATLSECMNVPNVHKLFCTKKQREQD